jgi:hypothetical protein
MPIVSMRAVKRQEWQLLLLRIGLLAIGEPSNEPLKLFSCCTTLDRVNRLVPSRIGFETDANATAPLRRPTVSLVRT